MLVGSVRSILSVPDWVMRPRYRAGHLCGPPGDRLSQGSKPLSLALPWSCARWVRIVSMALGAWNTSIRVSGAVK